MHLLHLRLPIPPVIHTLCIRRKKMFWQNFVIEIEYQMTKLSVFIESSHHVLMCFPMLTSLPFSHTCISTIETEINPNRVPNSEIQHAPSNQLQPPFQSCFSVGDTQTKKCWGQGEIFSQGHKWLVVFTIFVMILISLRLPGYTSRHLWFIIRWHGVKRH